MGEQSVKIEQIINENRQSLFHGTSVRNAYDILRKGKIEPRTQQVLDGNKISGVSTSRSKKFALDWGHVMFEFNADAIRHHNKVVPVDFLQHSPHYNVDKRHCSEEFVIGELNNIQRSLSVVYIKSTARHSDYYDDILDILNDKYMNTEVVEL